LKKATTSRTLALEVLDKIYRTDGYADIVLDSFLKNAPALDQRDKSLASNLVYGVLRRQNFLDAHIVQASARPLRKIKPRLLSVLRLGAYQLFFLDRIPARAAVNETVNLSKYAGFSHAAGFVNAVMRKLSSEDWRLELPEDRAARLSLLFGCPVNIVKSWIEEYNVEGAEAMLGQVSRIPSRWLRIDSRKISRDQARLELEKAGIKARPGAFAPESLLVEACGDLREISLVAERKTVVQDQASQLIAHLVNPEPGWKILDACAAPGMKATHMAQLAGGDARVFALEVHPARARAMAEICREYDFKNVEIIVADALSYKVDTFFDAVLADAPCSGLGVLNRNPEAKWRMKPEKLNSLPDFQYGILSNLADCVRPGGLLVYSTCTSNRNENDEVVRRFLAQRHDFKLERPPPDAGVDWTGLTTADGFLKTYPRPAEDDESRTLDGFFGARMRRSDANP